MDLGTLGLNAAIIGGIIGILQGIKALDTAGKLAKGFYIIAAMAFGFACGFIVTAYSAPFVQWVQKAAGAGISYAGAASILYQTGKLVVAPASDDGQGKIINK
jgi:hypothetical protein